MKIVITKSQAKTIISSLEMSVNPDYPKSDSLNSSYLRLIKKIEKVLDEC